MSVVVEVVREAQRRHAWLTTLALAHLALLVLLIVGASIDDRQILGINRWIKPMKFAASIAIYLGALAWYAPELGTERARRWPLTLALVADVSAAACGAFGSEGFSKLRPQALLESGNSADRLVAQTESLLDSVNYFERCLKYLSRRES